MLKQLKSFKGIMISIFGSGILITSTALTIVLSNSTKYSKNYLVQVIDIYDQNDSNKKYYCINKKDQWDEKCKFFAISYLEKDKLFNGKNTEIETEKIKMESSHFFMDQFLKLKLSFAEQKYNVITLKRKDEKTVKFRVLCNLDDISEIESLKEKNHKLIGKITSKNINIAVDKTTKFTCSTFGYKDCDIGFLDMQKISLISDIGPKHFSKSTKDIFLKTGDYVSVDLKENYSTDIKRMIIKTNQKQFTVEFDKNILSKLQTQIKKSTPETIQHKSNYGNQNYFIFKFSGWYGFPNLSDVILKTIDENPKEYWWDWSGDTINNNAAEIYEITEQNAVEKNKLSSLDKENKLIQRADYFQNKHSGWFKIIFKKFDLINYENFELKINRFDEVFGFYVSECKKRISTSTKLINC